jgi:hypothetical protein
VTNFGQSEVRFVIPAANLEEAFSKYEDELKKFSDEMKKQIAQRQQAAAAAQQSPAPVLDEQTDLKLVTGVD